MSELRTNVTVDPEVKALILNVLGQQFGADGFQEIINKMINDPRDYDYAVAKTVDLYYTWADEDSVVDNCKAADRYVVEMYMRMYIYNRSCNEAADEKQVEPDQQNDEKNNAEEELPEKCKECGKCKNMDEVNKHHEMTKRILHDAMRYSDPFLGLISAFLAD